MANDRLSMEIRHRYCLALVLLALVASGCGLSGGSVPTGPPRPGRVAGVVVRALDPSVPLPGAQVTVEDAGGGVHRFVTDARGTFALENLPAGVTQISAAGQVVSATGMMQEESARVTALVAPGLTVNLLLAALSSQAMPTAGMPPGGVMPSDPLVVRIDPQGSTSTASAPVSTGIVGPMPSWVVEGGVGLVGPDGAFHALAVGTGTIHAVFPDGEQSRPVQVSL